MNVSHVLFIVSLITMILTNRAHIAPCTLSISDLIFLKDSLQVCGKVSPHIPGQTISLAIGYGGDDYKGDYTLTLPAMLNRRICEKYMYGETYPDETVYMCGEILTNRKHTASIVFLNYVSYNFTDYGHCTTYYDISTSRFPFIEGQTMNETDICHKDFRDNTLAVTNVEMFTIHYNRGLCL